jgi:hypothetical protein
VRARSDLNASFHQLRKSQRWNSRTFGIRPVSKGGSGAVDDFTRLLTDSAFRAVLQTAIGDPAAFVAVDAMHQGPQGDGPVIAIVDLLI